MAAFDQGTLSKYNSLTDRHLVSYFSNDRMRHHLIKNGLITKTGEVIPDAVYRVRMARREHRRRVRNLIAQAIIHKALEMERSRQIDIRKKIEEIAKIELVRRVREERVRIGDEDCTPYFNPGNMEISVKSAIERKRTQSDMDEFMLSPSSEEKSRSRLRKILPTDEIESKHLSQLDSLTLGEYSKILQKQDRDRINRLPYLGLGSDFIRNKRKQTRLKKIKKKQKKPKESAGDDLINIDLDYKPLRMVEDEPISNLRNEGFLSIDSKNPTSLLENTTDRMFFNYKAKSKSKSSNENLNNMNDDKVIVKSNSNNLKSSVKKKKIKLLRKRRFLNMIIKSGRSLQSRLQSMTKLSILFHSPTQNRGYDVMVEQQPSGGNTLTLFRDTLTSNSVFTIVSQRHRGFPFSLTFYINNVKDSRISTCCEFKHKVGKRIGGPNGHFSLFSVEDAIPCYKCRTEQDMINERKNKKDSKASEQELNYQESVSMHPNSENPDDTDDEFESDTDSSSSSDSGHDEKIKDERVSSRLSKQSSSTVSENHSKLETKSDKDIIREITPSDTDTTLENQHSPISENYNNNAVENDASKDSSVRLEKKMRSPIEEDKYVADSVENQKHVETLHNRRLSDDNNAIINNNNKNVRKNSPITVENQKHVETIHNRRLSNENNAIINNNNKNVRKNSLITEKEKDTNEVKSKPIDKIKNKIEEMVFPDKTTRESSPLCQTEDEVMNEEEIQNCNVILENTYHYEDEDKKENHSVVEIIDFENLNNSDSPIDKENDEAIAHKKLSISSENDSNTENSELKIEGFDNNIIDIVGAKSQSDSNSRPIDLEHTDKVVSNPESSISKNDIMALGSMSIEDGSGSTDTRLDDLDDNEPDVLAKSDIPLENEDEVKSLSGDGDFEESNSSASNLMVSSSSSSIKNSADFPAGADGIKSPENFDESELKISLPNDDNESSKPTNSDRPLVDRDHEPSEFPENDKEEPVDLLESSNKGRMSKMSSSWSSSTEYETDSDENEQFPREMSTNQENQQIEEKLEETPPSEGTSILVEDDDINFKRAKEISQLFENEKVDSIKIKNCELPSYVFNYIAEKLAIHQELKSIELSGCEVEISLLNLLAKDLKNWPNLEKLILSENHFTDYSLQNLIDMIKFLYDNDNEKNLKLLDLSNCSIQPNDLEQLIDMIGKNTRVENFVLSGNPLTPNILQDIFQALQRNSHIELLNIENCGVNHAVMDELDDQLRRDVERKLKM